MLTNLIERTFAKARIHGQLASIHERAAELREQGRGQEAVEAYQQLLELWPIPASYWLSRNHSLVMDLVAESWSVEYAVINLGLAKPAQLNLVGLSPEERQQLCQEMIDTLAPLVPAETRHQFLEQAKTALKRL
ncbi:hypothetical protein [Mycobacterium sp.]|uniref:hypothetical protein n=1 Tax=Mycobacterium sp. TaxID=1785 RepID=UPI003F99AA6F